MSDGVDVTALLAAVGVAYLLGSVPVAVLVARAQRFDPRNVGDRNPGFWNMKEQLGVGGAMPVFVGDVAKGALAGLVGVALDTSAWGIAYAAVGAAMVGHAFPVFAGFRGGRSVLAFVGGMSVVAPAPAAVCVGILLVLWLVTRSFRVATLVAVFGFPVVQGFFDPLTHVAATGALMTIIGIRFAQAAWADRGATDQA